MLDRFHPAVQRWFTSRFAAPTGVQRRGWEAIRSGAHTLIAAPTGSGKTLAAFLSALDGLFALGLEGQLADETHVVYVSPLKALSNDIHKNLEEPLAGIRAALAAMGFPAVEVRAEVRTGDTSASRRQAIARRPPHVLVTTPESFYLLLTSVSGRKVLRTARALIVDEIHAVAGNRRGSHLALSMERLSALCGRPVQRIGLSATQRPMEEVARFLVGTRGLDGAGAPRAAIVDEGHAREVDLCIEVPHSPLEAVMAAEVWEEVYGRLAELIQTHRTTLVFVNTRRLAERVTQHLSERLGDDAVTSHHGSLAAKLRLDAEKRLKEGRLKALVATASLELGIDIGSVDLVCQLGSPHAITALLQRVGRSGHALGARPKGRLFPLSRDDLVECAALVHCVRRGELDLLEIPEKPLDILAQQVVAAVACEDWEEGALFDLMKGAFPYRGLSRREFDDVVRMLADGFSTRRGRRGAHLHHDAVNGRIRGRRGARLAALTSGGAIPDNADYGVVLEPGGAFIGTLNEDFAIESMAGDIFQLGNASWRILRVERGTVRVEDARGQPPTLPFWLGEAPSRTAELSFAVSRLRAEMDRRLDEPQSAAGWLRREANLSDAAAQQLVEYLGAARRALGLLPTQESVVMERFFDEAGGMQLVIHSAFGSRINRAWGLALRKRFCRSFNFELQAAAVEDALVLSLGPQHSFPLEDVFRFLSPATARDVLVQALLDAPMFTARWRWNAARALAVPRRRGGRRTPAPIQRMEAEDLIAAVFPDQLACAENLVGDREIPDHPLVRQTIEDCLVEAMDIEGLMRILEGLEKGSIRAIARDLPEPSPLAHEILNAKPYAFLDDAPLEERRTQAVYQRRVLDPQAASDIGALDPAAIERVREEAWPQAATPDEAHDALLLLGVLFEDEARSAAGGTDWLPFLEHLAAERRAGRFLLPAAGSRRAAWTAAESLAMVRAVYAGVVVDPPIEPPARRGSETWEPAGAVRELLRGRLEACGPVAAAALGELFGLPAGAIDAGLLALEAEGFVLRGSFTPGMRTREWCDRRLLARIHRLTLNRLRTEIEPVNAADFLRFLLAWQRLGAERVAGPDGLLSVMEVLEGFGAPAGAWESDLIPARVTEYDPLWLDGLTLSGQVGWARLSPPGASAGGAGPLKSTPIALFLRENEAAWLGARGVDSEPRFSAAAREVLAALEQGGASFFRDIVKRSGLLPTHVEASLGELAAAGRLTSDSFAGLRALLVPASRRKPIAGGSRRRRHAGLTLENAGRWSLLRTAGHEGRQADDSSAADEGIDTAARALLRRYGVVFRRLLERESSAPPWRDLARFYRRLEARGEIRGGRFVAGFTGEQFARPEAVGLLRSKRKEAPGAGLVPISAADPMNLAGIITPGVRVAAIATNRILLRDGLPIAALEGGKFLRLADVSAGEEKDLEQALVRRRLPPGLRAYY